VTSASLKNANSLNHAVSAEDKKPLYDVPTIQEYIADLDFVLKTVLNGPAKSFATRRLKYLSGKFTMYGLSNEFQELADMKVSRTGFMPIFRS
jgi:AMP deaminase